MPIRSSPISDSNDQQFQYKNHPKLSTSDIQLLRKYFERIQKLQNILGRNNSCNKSAPGAFGLDESSTQSLSFSLSQLFGRKISKLLSKMKVNNMLKISTRSTTETDGVQKIIKKSEVNSTADQLPSFPSFPPAQSNVVTDALQDSNINKNNAVSQPDRSLPTLNTSSFPLLLNGSDEVGTVTTSYTESYSETETTSSTGDERTTDSIQLRLDSFDLRLEKNVLFIPPEYIKSSTNNFHESGLLGEGGFGDVFKFKWRNTMMAVKRLKHMLNSTTKEELWALMKYRHENILSLFACSMTDEMVYLICELMDNKSLSDQLQKNPKKLSWSLRVDIAVGSAKGLQYLHLDTPPLIHGDIKPANILLDKNFVPKIGDFGLAKNGTEVQLKSPSGTIMYLPNDFLETCILTTAVDVYAFGIVLLQLATGVRAAFKPKGTDNYIIHLRDYVNSHTGDLIDLLDSNAGSKSKLYLKLIELGKTCTHEKSEKRPTMEMVYEELLALQDKIKIIEREYAGSHWDNLIEQGIIDNARPNLEDNILTKADMECLREGLGPPTFNVLLLYVQADKACAQHLKEKMTGEFGLKVCDPYHDFIRGHPLGERSIIMKLLTERGLTLLVILSNNFNNSKHHNSILNLAQASVDVGHAKLIRCISKNEYLPSDYTAYFRLDYETYAREDSFWLKLRQAFTKK